MSGGKWRGAAASGEATVLVEQRAPLALRLLGIAVVLVLAGVLVVWGIDLGQRLFGAGAAGPDAPAAHASAELERVSAERDALLVEKGRVAADAGRLAALEAENGKLAADLALLESLLPPVKPGAGLVIQGMQARMATPRQLHYTVLLGYGAVKGQPRFDGRLHLALTVSKDGQRTLLEFPGAQGGERYDVAVQRNARFDGTLELPDGAVAGALQVSLASKGKVVARQTVGVDELSKAGPAQP